MKTPRKSAKVFKLLFTFSPIKESFIKSKGDSFVLLSFISIILLKSYIAKYADMELALSSIFSDNYGILPLFAANG